MKLALAFGLIFLLSTSAFSLDLSREKPIADSQIIDKRFSECPGSMTKEDLFKIARDRNLSVYTLTRKGSDKVVAIMNSEFNKMNSRKPDSEKIALIPESAEFYYTPLAINTTGVVLVADGCVVFDTMQQYDSNTVSNFLARAGVTAEDMISEPVDTKPVNNAPKTH